MSETPDDHALPDEKRSSLSSSSRSASSRTVTPRTEDNVVSKEDTNLEKSERTSVQQPEILDKLSSAVEDVSKDQTASEHPTPVLRTDKPSSMLTGRRPAPKKDTKQQKKVQITGSAMKKPTTATSSKGARMSPDVDSLEPEPISSELHVVRNRMTRSAPVRPRQFYAQSSNLVFLQKECNKIEVKMKKMAKANLATRPKIAPYKPFTWNSLAPYYNTDTLRYIINMPVPVRRGYNTRATASGLVDPAVSWKMDHCLTPVTPSRPELFRQHYSKRRTKSAMPRVSYDKSILQPQYPKVSEATYDILTENTRVDSTRSRKPRSNRQ